MSRSGMLDQRQATVLGRVAWLVLGAVLAVLLLAGSRLSRAAAVMLPWAVGMTVLLRSRWAHVVSARWRDAVNGVAPQVALIVLAGLLALVSWAFGEFAVALLVTWVGLAALIAALVFRPESLREATVGLAFAGVSLAVALGAAEWVLQRPAIAAQYGLPAEQAAWGARYDHLWDHNIFDYRTTVEQVRAAPGVRRILVLGDSFTYGVRIAETDSTWPSVLERAIAAGNPGTEYEIVNLGYKAYTTANEAEVLRRLGWQFEPDLLVVQWLINDALPSGPDFEHQDIEDIFPPVELLPSSLRDGWIESSALLAFLNGRLTALRHGSDMAAGFRKLNAPESEGWKQMTAALREMGDAARARGVPAVLVLFPSFYPGSWTSETYSFREVNERVRRAAEAAGFHVLDLTPTFVAEGGDWLRWWATPYDHHPSVEAHAIAANAIYEFLVREQLLAGPEPAAIATASPNVR